SSAPGTRARRPGPHALRTVPEQGKRSGKPWDHESVLRIPGDIRSRTLPGREGCGRMLKQGCVSFQGRHTRPRLPSRSPCTPVAQTVLSAVGPGSRLLDELPGGNGLELHPAGADVPAGRHGPRLLFLLPFAPREGV